MCTCHSQLQPHDPLEGVCVPRDEHDRELDEFRDQLLTDQVRLLDQEDPYVAEMISGGQG